MSQLVNTISGNNVTTHQGFICEVLKCGTVHINAPPRVPKKTHFPLCLSLATLCVHLGPPPTFHLLSFELLDRSTGGQN